MLMLLGLAVLVWLVLEWAAVALLLRGLLIFLVGALALTVLAAGYGCFWLVDTGLGRVVDWLGEHCEELE